MQKFKQALIRCIKIHGKYDRLQKNAINFSCHEVANWRYFLKNATINLNFQKWKDTLVTCMGRESIELAMPTNPIILHQMMNYFHQHNIRWASGEKFEDFYLYHQKKQLGRMNMLIYDVEGGYIIWSERHPINPMPLEEFYQRFDTLESALDEHIIEILK